METNSAAGGPDRSGKTSARIPVRRAGKVDAAETQPTSTQPPPAGAGTLDDVRSVFWHAYRHLFPPHALAAQTPNGTVVISWSIQDEPGAKYPYAAPVMLRFDQDLVDRMWDAEPGVRARLAERQEPVLRQGMRGYDPFASVPAARVVVLG